MAMSRLLWAFDFRRAVDKNGNEIVPDMTDLTEGFLVQPKPFEADIRPRSSFKSHCVQKEWAAVTEFLDHDLQWKAVPEGLVWRDLEPTEA